MSFDPFVLREPEEETRGIGGLAHGVAMSIADTLELGASPAERSAGLDKNARYVVPGFRQNRHERRRVIKRAVATVLRDFERLAGCGQKATNSYELVKGVYGVPLVESFGTVNAHGVFTCSNKNLCLDCASKADAASRESLRAVVKDHEAMGGHVFMMTLTAAHGPRDALKKTLELVLKAFTKTVAGGGKQGERLKALGFQGGYKSLEHTHSYRNGHHPHIHMIGFFAPGTSDAAMAEVFVLLKSAWIKSVETLGGSCSGLNQKYQFANEGAGDYLNKRGISWEATARTSKEGRKGARTFFQIAEDWAEDRFPPDAELLREIAGEFHSKKRITPFGEIRKMYAGRVKTEWEDEFHGAENEASEQREICTIEADVFNQVAAMGKADLVIEAAESGGIVAVKGVLHNLGFKHGLWPPGVAKPVKRRPKKTKSPLTEGTNEHAED